MDVEPLAEITSLEETVAVLGDPEELAVLREGLADLDAGRVVSLEALRANLPDRG